MSLSESAHSRQIQDRQHWMKVLAAVTMEDLLERWQALDLSPPAYKYIRRPETMLLMTQGRIGGDGPPFNLGEVTVTRCAVRLEQGVVGVSYIMGRDKQHAEQAALIDGLLQDPIYSGQVFREVIQPLAQLLADRKQALETRTAETRVDFFTMVRGE